MSSTGTTAPSEPSIDSEDKLTGPLWKYVTKIVDDSDGGKAGGNVPFICNFCKMNFKGSHSRVKAHLLKIPKVGIKVCTKVTKAQMDEMQEVVEECEQKLQDKTPRTIPLPPSSSRLSSNASYFPLEVVDLETKKRRGMSPQLTKAFRKEERQQCDAAIARMFYTGGLSFNLARNPHYQDAFARASNLPGYKPPGYNALRTTLLDSEKQHIDRMLVPIKDTWKQIGVTVCSDGWTDEQRRPLINMMAASKNGAVMIKAINCEGQYKDKFEVSRLLLETINEIGAQNVIQVVTDNAPVCAAAGAIVEATYPHIFWTPCVVHTLNLVLKDTLKAKSFLPGESVDEELGWLMDVINDVWFIKNFVINHSMRLSMYNDHCSLRLLQVAETRFASHYVSIKRFREMKVGLQSMVICPKWDLYKEDDAPKARRVKEMLLDDNLWDQIDFMIAFMEPIYDMIRMRDLDRPCLHLVYEWWDSMIEKVKKSIFKPEFVYVITKHCEVSRFYDVLYSILIARWTKSSTPLHCLAHSLNPRYYSTKWLEEDPNRVAPHRDAELTTERRKCLQRLFPDPQVRNKVLEEYVTFSLNMKDYGTPEALENMCNFEPVVWWGAYGACTPLLQGLAFKLLNQPCSSSCCERNWSTYSFITGLKRNKLQPKRAQDLVYVHTNLRLLARRDPMYYKSQETMWDLAGDAIDSMEPGAFDVLDMANLSLDEPTLEMMLINDEMNVEDE